MEKWILSANPKYFNHTAAFHELGYIDWKQTRNYNIGDVIYVYVTKPVSRICFKTRVSLVNMTCDNTTDLSKYWVKEQPDSNDKKNRYVRIELLHEFEDDRLSFDILKKHGLLYVPQSPCKVKNDLQVFLKSVEGN